MNIFQAIATPLSLLILLYFYTWGTYFSDDGTIHCVKACNGEYDCVGMNRCERILTELSNYLIVSALIAIYAGYSLAKANLNMVTTIRAVLLLLAPMFFDFIIKIAIAPWIAWTGLASAVGFILLCLAIIAWQKKYF